MEDKTKPSSAKATADEEKKLNKKSVPPKKATDKKIDKRTETKLPKKENFDINIHDMLSAGVNFGHRTFRLHPKMQPYIEGIKSTAHIIDLNQTKEKLQQALEFIQKLSSEEKIILFVGTKIPIKSLVKNTAEECNMPYINERWLGGTFTNFKTILKRIELYKDVQNKQETGELKKYTKKERIKISKNLERMKIKFEGIKTLTRIPDALFVTDIKKDHLAIKEASMRGVKTIGICDTNTDPTLVDFPIPANDDAIASVRYILGKVKETILKSKTK